MKQAFVLLAIIALAFAVATLRFGYDATYQIGYGALTLMAALISVTFLGLWVARTTPLALGMAFSWAGAASVLGWWWVYNLLNRPEPMADSGVLFGFLSLYYVGAILHFAVMQRSLGWGHGAFAAPVAAVVLSTLIHLAL